MERLVAWMEDHRRDLRGSRVAWHKNVKDQVFSNEEHITMEKIGEKVANMKLLWKDTRRIRDLSGWGDTSEDNEESINEILEWKCMFYWRLDSIWGTIPNAIPIVNMESLRPPTTAAPPAAPSQLTSKIAFSASSPPPIVRASVTPRSRRLETSLYPSRQRSGKRDFNDMLQALESKYAVEEELALKRIKIETGMWLKKTNMLLKAEFQADARAKQMKTFS